MDFFMYFTDLRIYKIGIQLNKEINQLVSKIPFNWNVPEVGQIKRSSSSVPSNIAEGFSKRFHQKEFARFLRIALGSSDETQNHIILLFNNQHMDEDKYHYFLNEYKNLSIKILNMIKTIGNNIEIAIH